MYELNNDTLKQLCQTNKEIFRSEKIAAVGFAMLGITTIGIFKFYGSVGHTLLDGRFSDSVPYSQFAESYLLGACLYMPFWYAAVSAVFISARERATLQQINSYVKSSVSDNEQTILRRACWNVIIIPEKLGVNSWVGLIVYPYISMMNGYLFTLLAAKLNGVDRQLADDMASLGAVSTCFGATIINALNLVVRYRFTGHMPPLFPNNHIDDEISDSESDIDVASEIDSDSEDELIVTALGRHATKQGTLFAVVWEHAKQERTQIVEMLDQYHASTTTSRDRPGIIKLE